MQVTPGLPQVSGPAPLLLEPLAPLLLLVLEPLAPLLLLLEPLAPLLLLVLPVPLPLPLPLLPLLLLPPSGDVPPISSPPLQPAKKVTERVRLAAPASAQGAMFRISMSVLAFGGKSGRSTTRRAAG
jgi:hypothetical protein